MSNKKYIAAHGQADGPAANGRERPKEPTAGGPHQPSRVGRAEGAREEGPNETEPVGTQTSAGEVAMANVVRLTMDEEEKMIFVRLEHGVTLAQFVAGDVPVVGAPGWARLDDVLDTFATWQPFDPALTMKKVFALLAFAAAITRAIGGKR